MVSFVVISGVLFLSSCVVMYYVTFVVSVVSLVGLYSRSSFLLVTSFGPSLYGQFMYNKSLTRMLARPFLGVRIPLQSLQDGAP